MKKFFKGIFVLISICCIAFTLFFVGSIATGNTSILSKLETGIAKISHSSANSQTSSQESTLAMLKNDFGLSTNQAGQIISMASQLGVDTNDPVEMRSFIVKNADKKDEIKDIANMYQNGQISEAQAKAMLAGTVNL